MGSGSHGPGYSSPGGSQPYAPTYHVVSTELESDKSKPYIYDPNKGYFKNPTATKLESAINGTTIYIDGKRQDGKITYVLDTSGNIIIGKRVNPIKPGEHAPHPTLIGGKNPQVQCAGMIKFCKGKIVSVDDNSGHYRPSSKSMAKVYEALKALYDKHPGIFHKDFKWR